MPHPGSTASSDVPQGQVGRAVSGTTRGRNVPLTLQRHSIFRWNENEQRGFKGQSRGWERKTVPPLVTGVAFPDLLYMCDAGSRWSGVFQQPQPGLWVALRHGLAELPRCLANLVPGQHQQKPGHWLGCCPSARTLDGFYEGRSSQLLKRNFFPLPSCLLLGKAFSGSVDMNRQMKTWQGKVERRRRGAGRACITCKHVFAPHTSPVSTVPSAPSLLCS